MGELDEAFEKRSSLTKVQVECIKLHILVKQGLLKGGEAAKRRGKSGSSPGSYYRVLSQSRKNIVSSLFTLSLAMRLGAVRTEDVEHLVNLVSRIPREIDDGDASQVISLIDVLTRRLVMI